MVFIFVRINPKATLPAYRKVCDCRKPEPGNAAAGGA